MIIQMHLGEILPTRQTCIESVRNVYRDEKYLWIDDDDINSHIENMNYFLSIDRTWPMVTTRDKIDLSDWIRFFYLSQYDDAMWMDTDVTIKKRFEPDPITYGVLPYMGVGDNDDAQDYAWIICNGCSGWFDKILKRRVAENRVGILCNEIDGSIANKIHLEYFHHHGSPNNLHNQPERHLTNERRNSEKNDLV